MPTDGKVEILSPAPVARPEALPITTYVPEPLPIGADHDDSIAIAHTRQEIARLADMSPDVHQVSPINTSPEITSSPPKSIIDNIKASLQRLRYPGNSDSAHTLAQVILPALSAELVALVPGTASTVINLAYQHGLLDTYNPLLNQVASVTNPIAAGSYAIMLLGLGKFVIENIAEARQQHLYGKLLTVNKVAFKPSSGVGKTFPEVSDSLYGELHFLGKTTINPQANKERNKLFQQPPIVVLRQGLRDLLTLARACQANSPELDGLDVFIGPHSPMITESLAELGFDIRTPISDDRLADRIFRPVTRYIGQVVYRSLGITTPNRRSLACLITRQELINQIPKLEQFTRH